MDRAKPPGVQDMKSKHTPNGQARRRREEGRRVGKLEDLPACWEEKRAQTCISNTRRRKQDVKIKKRIRIFIRGEQYVAVRWMCSSGVAPSGIPADRDEKSRKQ